MSKAKQQIAVAEHKPLTDEQIDLIRKTVAKDCNPAELELFLFQCARTGLDPLSRQIHATKRQGKLVIVTGIDGYRLIADRTGQYAGGDDPVFDAEGAQHPNKATATVWKLVGGQRVPFTRSARWAEFFPGEQQGFMWKRMPYHMLGKCAEALALRAAFPQELSGVYTSDEIGQGDVIDAEVETVKPAIAAKPASQGPAPIPKTEAPPKTNGKPEPKPMTGAEFDDWLHQADLIVSQRGRYIEGQLLREVRARAEQQSPPFPAEFSKWAADEILHGKTWVREIDLADKAAGQKPKAKAG